MFCDWVSNVECKDKSDKKCFRSKAGSGHLQDCAGKGANSKFMNQDIVQRQFDWLVVLFAGFNDFVPKIRQIFFAVGRG